MDLSGLWNQLLLNTTATVCIRPNVSLVPGIQVITPAYVISNDTNSSISSESTANNIPAAKNNYDEQYADEIEKTETAQQSDDCCDEDADFQKKTDEQKKRSIQRVRYSKEEYKCKSCPYTCTTEKAFLKHLRLCVITDKVQDQNEDNTDSPVSCPICGKDRRTEEILSIHMIKHKQDRHFCCDICKFKSLQLKKLIQHRRMHTGEKPHLCPFCTYRSSRRDNLRSHVRRVHKKNDLPCDTFTPRSMLLTPRKV